MEYGVNLQNSCDMVDMSSRYGALKIAKSAILRELGEYY